VHKVHCEREVFCVVLGCYNLMLIGYGTVDRALVMGGESVMKNVWEKRGETILY
jgi:hypothetical protein